MASKSELACVYSALILHDDDVAITADKIQTLVNAAKIEIEPFWPGLFAKALEGHNINDLILSAGAPGAGGAPATTGSSTAADAPKEEAKKEEKKEESEEESDADMGFGLFD